MWSRDLRSAHLQVLDVRPRKMMCARTSVEAAIETRPAGLGANERTATDHTGPAELFITIAAPTCVGSCTGAVCVCSAQWRRHGRRRRARTILPCDRRVLGVDRERPFVPDLTLAARSPRRSAGHSHHTESFRTPPRSSQRNRPRSKNSNTTFHTKCHLPAGAHSNHA